MQNSEKNEVLSFCLLKAKEKIQKEKNKGYFFSWTNV